MITHLQGRLAEALPTLAVIDVNGVGYEVLIPLSSFDRLPPVGTEVRMLTHLAVREDAHVLYGFMTAPERDLFRLLIQTVSGIGPRMALSVLSGLPIDSFRAAVLAHDVKALSAISGIGRKTAERIVVELKDKLGGFAPSTAPGTSPRPTASGGESRLADAAAALTALGVKPADAQESVRAAAAVLGSDATVEQLVRACLRSAA